jgi:hypothetical protein
MPRPPQALAALRAAASGQEPDCPETQELTMTRQTEPAPPPAKDVARRDPEEPPPDKTADEDDDPDVRFDDWALI